MIERIKRSRLITPIYRALHPYDSTCFICGLPWSSCKEHTTNMVECTNEHHGEGFFAVCEYCWQHSEWKDIEDAITQLYAWWITMTAEPPYRLQNMIDKAKEDYKKNKR